MKKNTKDSRNQERCGYVSPSLSSVALRPSRLCQLSNSIGDLLTEPDPLTPEILGMDPIAADPVVINPVFIAPTNL